MNELWRALLFPSRHRQNLNLDLGPNTEPQFQLRPALPARPFVIAVGQ